MSLPIYNISAMDNVPRAVSGGFVYVYTQPTTGITLPSFDGNGNIVPGVWTPSAAPLATIYEDGAGSVVIPNPFKLDGNGNGWFYAVSGLYTVVIVGATLNAPIILPDQALLTTSAGGLTIQTNGSANSNQGLLNLVQGSNITVTNSGGNTTISGTAAPINFKINNTDLSSQVIANFINGTGISIADGGSGQVVISSTNGAVIEVDGTPVTDQSTLSLNSGNGVKITNPTDGQINFVGTPVYSGSGTPLVAPEICFGTATLTDGTVTVTLPITYTSAASYVVQATQQGSGPSIPFNAQPQTANTFNINSTGPNANLLGVQVVSDTLIFVCDNNFQAGTVVTFSGVATATWLNGNSYTILTAEGGICTAAITYPNYVNSPPGPIPDTGSISSFIFYLGLINWIACGN